MIAIRGLKLAGLLGLWTLLGAMAAWAEPMVVSQGSLQAGYLLVARVGLGDPRFAESVVLLVDYTSRGSWGVVVNKPTDYRLQELYPDLAELGERADRLFWGGPVAPAQRLLLVQADEPPSPQSKALGGGLYLSGSLALLEELVGDTTDRRPFRLVGGYAGWGPGQLDREYARGDWFGVPASAELVLGTAPDKLWQQLMPGERVQMALLSPPVSATPFP